MTRTPLLAVACTLAGALAPSCALAADRPVPDDLTDKRVWMYASTADTTSPYREDRRELNGCAARTSPTPTGRRRRRGRRRLGART
jgi:hypothetical protein